jgi:multisite-specific tRNA:(cytosine-C5)-methyltransferase
MPSLVNEPIPSDHEDLVVTNALPEVGLSASITESIPSLVSEGSQHENQSGINRDLEDHSLGNGVKGPIMDIPVSALEEDEVHEDEEEVTDRIAATLEEEEVEEEGEGVATTTNQRATGSRFQRQGRWRGVDPVLFLEDEKVIGSLVAFYGIKETFPLSGHLVTRSEDSSRLKRIYYVSKSVSDVIRLNFSAGEHLKMTSAGLKIFVSTPESLPLWILCSMGGCGNSLALERAHLSKE